MKAAPASVRTWPGIDVCGKTGTAQLASNDHVERNLQGADP
jgi:cell division protein FtsI/penicillin-binding protein 2